MGQVGIGHGGGRHGVSFEVTKMGETEYRIISYAITREFEKDAKVGKALKSKVAEHVDKILEKNKDSKITILPWRDGSD